MSKKMPAEKPNDRVCYRDYSMVAPPECYGSLMENCRTSMLQTFPSKLHYLLTCADNTAEGLKKVVSWQPHGRCFAVHNTKVFVKQVLPNWFMQSKLASFQRQLNLYGFRRFTAGPDKGGYYHELFLRGRPDLAEHIRRTKVKGEGHRKAADPETEPNFYRHFPLPKNPALHIPVNQSLTAQLPAHVIAPTLLQRLPAELSCGASTATPAASAPVVAAQSLPAPSSLAPPSTTTPSPPPPPPHPPCQNNGGTPAPVGNRDMQAECAPVVTRVAPLHTVVGPAPAPLVSSTQRGSMPPPPQPAPAQPYPYPETNQQPRPHIQVHPHFEPAATVRSPPTVQNLPTKNPSLESAQPPAPVHAAPAPVPPAPVPAPSPFVVATGATQRQEQEQEQAPTKKPSLNFDPSPLLQQGLFQSSPNSLLALCPTLELTDRSEGGGAGGGGDGSAPSPTLHQAYHNEEIILDALRAAAPFYPDLLGLE